MMLIKLVWGLFWVAEMEQGNTHTCRNIIFFGLIFCIPLL